MIENPEERRKKRQQERLRRKAAQRRLLIRLILAVAALLLCGAVILIIVLGGKNRENKPVETPAATQQPQQEPEDTTVIHFAATGDLNVTSRVVASGGEQFDYAATFMDIAPVLASADLTTVNLEGDFGEYSPDKSNVAPPSMAKALSDAGVDMIQLANSYAISQGISGLRTTISEVQKAGMEPVGVFDDDHQFRQKKGFSLFEVQGVRIAVVAFTKGMDGDTLLPGYENCVNILYSDYNTTYQTVDRERITQVMEAVEQQKPDITIALLHWGGKYNENISKTQMDICQLLQEHGTDAIIGTHPHFVQKIDFDPEEGTLVAYSLGDLIGDAPKPGTEYSVVLDLEITKNNETGDAAITGYSYTPVFTVKEEGQPVRVVRIREAIAAYEAGYINRVSQQTYEEMKYALTRIEERLRGE